MQSDKIKSSGHQVCDNHLQLDLYKGIAHSRNLLDKLWISLFDKVCKDLSFLLAIVSKLYWVWHHKWPLPSNWFTVSRCGDAVGFFSSRLFISWIHCWVFFSSTDCLWVGSIVEFFSLDCLLVGSEFNCPNSNQSHCCCQFIGNLWFIFARLYFTFILNEILKYQAQVIITNYIHVWRKEFLWWFLGNSVVGTVILKTNCITLTKPKIVSRNVSILGPHLDGLNLHGLLN